MSVTTVENNLDETKSHIPSQFKEALELVDKNMKVHLLVGVAHKYQIPDDDFTWLLQHCSGAELGTLAKVPGRFMQVWNYAHGNSHMFNVRDILNVALAGERIDLAILFVGNALTKLSLHELDTSACLNFLQQYLLQKIKEGPLHPDNIALAEIYLAKGTRGNSDATLDTHLLIARAINKTTSIELVWRTRMILEARLDTSDFGEDDDRDSRLERIYKEAVAQLPHLQSELAEFAVGALEHVGRKMLAGQLASKLGLHEKARTLFLEVRTKLLSKESPFSGFDKSRIGECSFKVGEYEAAYGHYLLAGDKYGMFKAAWEFDRARAAELAQEIADQAIGDPYYALNGALPIVMQAGLPAAQHVYESGIKRLEENNALKQALRFAEAYGDTVRVARYQLLMTL